jgi:hypothetical protein
VVASSLAQLAVEAHGSQVNHARTQMGFDANGTRRKRFVHDKLWAEKYVTRDINHF